ncbi:helix-turn-helix domain-containing protein [Nocardiopsis sp. FR26]|uniref:helix-turn-helix domain-containing protein n=1 Tax=Nocardiopsis sp. FR26 TaxID=2605987 RepID=UPI00191575E4|nr:helix-turn-helix domain-containing protein [Nocardiopsis sp. FR26]
MAPITSPRLYSIPQAAEHLGCCRDHVYTLISAGQLAVTDISGPGAKRPKSRIPEDSLVAYIRSRTTQAASA